MVNAIFVQLYFLVMGFIPITSLSAHLFGIINLQQSTLFLVLPSLAGGIILGWQNPRIGRIAFLGFLAGLAATGIYDVSRLACVYFGVWDDFIPRIGYSLFESNDVSPIWGYLWRFLLNGGCMGISFAMLPFSGSRFGTWFGTLVWFGLLGTLEFAPGAQNALFHLNMATFLASLLGHLEYGSVLGALTIKMVCPDWYLPLSQKNVLMFVSKSNLYSVLFDLNWRRNLSNYLSRV